jgi:hypothetical protein
MGDAEVLPCLQSEERWAGHRRRFVGRIATRKAVAGKAIDTVEAYLNRLNAELITRVPRWSSRFVSVPDVS